MHVNKKYFIFKVNMEIHSGIKLEKLKMLCHEHPRHHDYYYFM